MPKKEEWKQLNFLPENSLYTEFPIPFTGKNKAFAGLNLSCQFILAEVHTMNKAYKEHAKLTYEHFIEKFGMSKETISAAFKTLIDERGILKRKGQSQYSIVPKYTKKNYTEIDNYWLKREWEINGNKKRLSRSRLLTLSLLKRSNENEKNNCQFTSSQARIGKALCMPRTTAGDSVRELVAAGLIRTEKLNGNDKQKRGCCLYTVNPAILKVKHPEKQNKQTMKSFQEYKADELHKRFMLDTEYKKLIERINTNAFAKITEILHNNGEDTPALAELGKETARLRIELEKYLMQRQIKRDVFPPGFFKCDDVRSDQN